jgi:hypothetical protein
MSNSEPFDADALDEPTERDEAEFQGFDEFWDETLRQEAAEHGHAPTETIRGVTIKVPQDLPLRYEQKSQRLKDSSDDRAFADLLAELFGVDVLDVWREAGMGAREFRVILAWGLSHGKGKPITFREAYEVVRSKDDGEDAEGKGQSSTPASGASGSTGRSSKRTSSGSTASRRKR